MAEKITRPCPSSFRQLPEGQRRRPVPTTGDILNLVPRKNGRLYLDISTLGGSRRQMEIEVHQGTAAGNTFRQLCAGGHYSNIQLYRQPQGGGTRWRGGDNGFVFLVRTVDGQLQDESNNKLFGKVVNGLDVLLHATGAHVYVTGCGELA